MPKKLTETEKLIANALLQKRAELKISQAQLAKIINSPSGSSWIGAAERGQKSISIAKLDSLLRGMNTNLSQLLLEHSLLSGDSKDFLDKDRLKCWNLIKNFDPGQVKILYEVLKIIDKHKHEINVKPLTEPPRKLRLARKKRKD